MNKEWHDHIFSQCDSQQYSVGTSDEQALAELERAYRELYTEIYVHREVTDQGRLAQAVIDAAIESVDCCNVFGKRCGVEPLRKAVKAYQGQPYAPAFQPKGKSEEPFDNPEQALAAGKALEAEAAVLEGQVDKARKEFNQDVETQRRKNELFDSIIDSRIKDWMTPASSWWQEQQQPPIALNRAWLPCPFTKMDENWGARHDPECDTCGGSGMMGGPITCSNMQICHDEGFTRCQDCPVTR